mgnify:CR=1 FL=1
MEKTEYIEINGVKHFFITYEYDEDMPVILYVHGGPGMAETLAGWEMAGYRTSVQLGFLRSARRGKNIL